MDLARFVVEAVILEGRSCRDVAGSYGVSKSWVSELVKRFRTGGEEALVPRSRAPRRIPHRTPAEVEERIVAMRKGLDAGASTRGRRRSATTSGASEATSRRSPRSGGSSSEGAS